MEQVFSWTQEREERQKREGRRRGAALTDPQSLETVTDWNHRLLSETSHSHRRHTQHTDAHFLFPSITLPSLFKSTGKHAHAMAQCIIPAECMGVMFVWNIFIPLWLHHSVIT